MYIYYYISNLTVYKTFQQILAVSHIFAEGLYTVPANKIHNFVRSNLYFFFWDFQEKK